MVRRINVFAFAVLFVMALGLGTAGATSLGALQGVLDGITTGPVFGDSSVDVHADFIADEQDSTWSVTASGSAITTLVVELANYAGTNTFGIYDPNGGMSSMVEIFSGPDAPGGGFGSTATLTVLGDGSVGVNGTNTGVVLTSTNSDGGYLFGFYIDSTGSNANGGVFHSDTGDNVDGEDHMLAYQGTGDTVQIDGFAAGTWTDDEYILAFEDLLVNSDWDYTDMVVMVESVQVPEPSMLLLLGIGFLGLGIMLRRRNMESMLS